MFDALTPADLDALDPAALKAMVLAEARKSLLEIMHRSATCGLGRLQELSLEVSQATVVKHPNASGEDHTLTGNRSSMRLMGWSAMRSRTWWR
jgi:hypothetical protein